MPWTLMLNKKCFDTKSDTSVLSVKDANYVGFGQALITMKTKTRATIQFLIMAVIATLLFTVLNHIVPAIIVGTLSVVILISGIFFKSIFIKIEKFGKRLGRWVGIGISWMLLVPLFYLVFFLGRLILGLTKKDPLDRKFPSLSKTCWSEKKAKTNSKESYRRLF